MSAESLSEHAVCGRPMEQHPSMCGQHQGCVHVSGFCSEAANLRKLHLCFHAEPVSFGPQTRSAGTSPWRRASRRRRASSGETPPLRTPGPSSGRCRCVFISFGIDRNSLVIQPREDRTVPKQSRQTHSCFQIRGVGHICGVVLIDRDSALTAAHCKPR